MNVYGNLVRAQLEVIVDPAAGTTGRLWLNTTEKEPKFDDGSKIHKILSAEKETPFALDNNVGATNVTGLLLVSVSFHRYEIKFAIRRRDDSAEQDVMGTIIAIFKKDAATWDLQIDFSGNAEGGQPAGTTFTITGAGQVQYATVDFNGGVGAGYAGALVFDIVKRFSNFAT